MGVLGCDEKTAFSMIKELGYADQVEVACFNSPVNLTISGDPAQVDAVLRHAQAKQIFARGFNTGGKAYHSKHMALIGERYEQLIAPVLQSRSSTCASSTTMTSSLFARNLTRSDARDPKYWRQNLEKPVLFSQAMTSALAGREYHVVEIGPHSSFKIAMEDISTSLSCAVQYSPTMIRGIAPIMTIMQLTGIMFLNGFDAPIKKINGILSPFASGDLPVVVTTIPPYPWKRGPLLWSEGRISSEYRQRAHLRHDLLGTAVVGGSKNVYTWRNMLKLQDVPWLHDHKLRDILVFPASAYIAMIIEGFRQVITSRNIELTSVLLREIKFLAMLTFDDDDIATELFTELCPMQNSLVHPSEDKFCFTISSFASTKATIHCRGMVEMGTDGRDMSKSLCRCQRGDREDGWATRSACDSCAFRLRSPVDMRTTMPKATWYDTMRKEGLNFGPAFQLLDDIEHVHENNVREVFSTCHPASCSPATGSSPVHPTVIDSLFQASIISTTSGRRNEMKGKIPVSIDRLKVTMKSANATSTVRARSTFGSQYTAICDAEMFDGDKALVLVNGLQIAPWLKHDFNHDVAPREPFLEKIWIPERELEPQKNGLATNGVNGVNGTDDTDGVHGRPSGLIVRCFSTLIRSR